jgi:ATP-dependent Clp protease ATP-binding subunit ClpA
VFEAAVDEMARLGHESIRVEHIFLATLAMEQGSAAAALDTIALDRLEVRRQIESSLPAGTPRQRAGEYPYHPTGVLVVKGAMEEATGSAHLSTAHILSATLAGKGNVRAILEATGVDIATLVTELRGRADAAE